MHLVDAGFEVVVVEARDRVGGRVWSVDVDGFDRPVELGPVLVPDDEPLVEALGAASVDTVPFDGVVEARTPEGVAVAIPPTGDEAVDAARSWAEAATADVSLAAALVGSGTVPMPAVPGADGLSPAAWLAHTIASGVQPATGATTNRVSARTAPTTAFPPGSRLVTGRLSDLLEALADRVDIAVSSVVTRVAYDDRRVSLRLDSGESVTVDRAIVTVPLGVLKSDTLRFSPALPYAHQHAIATLETGAVDVVWLRFDEAFWRSGPGDDGAAASDQARPDRPARRAHGRRHEPRGRRVARRRARDRRGDPRRGHRGDAGASTGVARRSGVPDRDPRRSRALRHSARLTATSSAVIATKITSTSAQ